MGSLSEFQAKMEKHFANHFNRTLHRLFFQYPEPIWIKQWIYSNLQRTKCFDYRHFVFFYIGLLPILCTRNPIQPAYFFRI